MKQWSVRYPLLMVEVCLLASLAAAGCADRHTKGGEPEDSASEEEVVDPIRTSELDADELADLAQITAGNRSDFAPVDLSFNDLDDDCEGEWADDACVGAFPEAGSIWKEDGKNKGRPKKVKWWIDDAQKGYYYWEIVYKGEDPAENWLGEIPPIDCNSKKTKSPSVSKDVEPGDDLVWPYRITVWKCKDGEKDPEDCLCRTDPRIEIHG